MKVKELFKWQMITATKSLCIYYGIIYVIYLLAWIMFATTKSTGVSGMDASSKLYCALFGLGIFIDTFKIALGNGVSRKTMLVTQLIMCSSISVFMTIMDLGNRFLYALISNDTQFTMIGSMYPEASLISTILYTVSTYFMLGMIGYFIASLNNRLNKTGKFVVYISIGAVLIILIPLFASYLYETGPQWWLNFMNFASQVIQIILKSPYYAVGIALTFSAIAYLFSVLLVRRADLRTV